MRTAERLFSAELARGASGGVGVGVELKERREANDCANSEFNRVKRAKLENERAKSRARGLLDDKAEKQLDRERANRASAAASRAKIVCYARELEKRTDRLERDRNAHALRAERAIKKLTVLREETRKLKGVLRSLWELKDPKTCSYLVDSNALFLLASNAEEQADDDDLKVPEGVSSPAEHFPSAVTQDALQHSSSAEPSPPAVTPPPPPPPAVVVQRPLPQQHYLATALPVPPPPTAVQRGSRPPPPPPPPPAAQPAASESSSQPRPPSASAPAHAPCGSRIPTSGAADTVSTTSRPATAPVSIVATMVGPPPPPPHASSGGSPDMARTAYAHAHGHVVPHLLHARTTSGAPTYHYRTEVHHPYAQPGGAIYTTAAPPQGALMRGYELQPAAQHRSAYLMAPPLPRPPMPDGYAAAAGANQVYYATSGARPAGGGARHIPPMRVPGEGANGIGGEKATEPKRA